jgi:hypothetical protein
MYGIRGCHINCGCMSRLVGLNLILKFDMVKSSKCHVCVEAKQPCKPHKATVMREIAPLEIIHSDICEMNGELTKDGVDAGPIGFRNGMTMSR